MIMRPPQQGHGGRWSAATPAAGSASSCSAGGSIDRHGRGDQFSGARDIGLAGGAGEQPVVTDAVEALGQDVEQEAPDELVGRERHGAEPRLPVAAVVLVAEGDAALVEADEAAVRDGDAVGVAGEIGEHRLGPGEGRLGVDEPVLLPERREMCGEGLSATQACRARRRTPAGPPRGRRRARPGRAAGTGGTAPAPARGSRVGSAPSACRRAISRRPARSCGDADGGSSPSPRCGARR